jgi:hypothetical protein
MIEPIRIAIKQFSFHHYLILIIIAKNRTIPPIDNGKIHTNHGMPTPQHLAAISPITAKLSISSLIMFLNFGSFFNN